MPGAPRSAITDPPSTSSEALGYTYMPARRLFLHASAWNNVAMIDLAHASMGGPLYSMLAKVYI